MERNEIEQLRKACAERLHKNPKMPLADAASIYLQYGMTINDKIDTLDSYDDGFYRQMFYNATHGWVRYLNDEIGKPVVFDFDLWADSLNFSKGLFEALGEPSNKLTPILETCQSIMVGMFRIWYEEITVENIRDFFDGKPCPELPDMSDMRKTFLWAMDNDIPCHDMTSYIRHNKEVIDNQTAEEEINYYGDMAKLRDSFDECDELFVTLGIPQEYLDTNRLQLREVYFAAVSFYEFLPPHTNVTKLYEEKSEELRRYYEKFLGIHVYPGINPDDIDFTEEKTYYYYIIFTVGLQMGSLIADMDTDDGSSDGSLFKEVIKHEMKKDRKRK